MLDDKIESVVNAVYPYVTDTIWLGYANHLETRLKWNGFGDAQHIEAAAKLKAVQTEPLAKALYEKWGADGKIRWKDSLKEILGLPEAVGSGDGKL